jgi:hypothetical protein
MQGGHPAALAVERQLSDSRISVSELRDICSRLHRGHHERGFHGIADRCPIAVGFGG